MNPPCGGFMVSDSRLLRIRTPDGCDISRCRPEAVASPSVATATREARLNPSAFSCRTSMANNWNIPDQLEKEVKLRDTACVYCGVKFKKNFRDGASWEHINNRAKDIEKWNIVLCCRSCNSSKGAKNILDWFKSQYCMDNNINAHTVAAIIKSYIKTHK